MKSIHCRPSSTRSLLRRRRSDALLACHSELAIIAERRASDADRTPSID